jgi:Protein of unknown function (DUF3168)
MADPSAVTSALIGKLIADPQLTALMPDGVYRDIAPHGKTRFVIVTKMTDARDYMLGGGMAFDELTYLVKAVERNTSGTNATTAASRIYTLLHNGALGVTGYGVLWMRLADENATIEYSEPDDDNPDDRWQHRGWQISIMVSA